MRFRQKANEALQALSIGAVLALSAPAHAAPTQAFVIQPISVPPAMINTTGCWPGAYIYLLNNLSQPGTVPVGSSVTINLAGTSTTSYYSDANCTQPMSSVTIAGSTTPVAKITVYAKDSVTETAALTVSGIDTTQYNLLNCTAAPQPTLPFPNTNIRNQSSQANVTGTMNSPDMNGDPVVMQTDYQTGETFTTEVVGTPTFTACPQVAASKTLTGEAIPSGKVALLSVYGTASYDANGAALPIGASGPTAGTLANALVRVLEFTSAASSSSSCPSGMRVTCSRSTGNCYCPAWVTVPLSSTVPAGIPPQITPNTLPANYKAIGYVALPAQPQDVSPGSYDSFTITTSSTGDLGYAVQADVPGSVSGVDRQFKNTGGTNFSPLLQFNSAKQFVASNSCSGVVNLILTDGNGVQTNVAPGRSLTTNQPNALAITVTSTPAGIFVDPACYFPAINMTASSPPPAQPAGTPANTLAYSTNQINFYFKSPVAETFTLGATFSHNQVLETAVPLAEQVNALNPVAITVTMPSAVNQSAPGGATNCSAAILISLKDSFGNLAGPQVCSKTLALTGSPTTVFYSDAACTQAIPGNRLNVPVGMGSISVYASDTVAESVTVSASDATNYASSACQGGSNGVTAGAQMQANAGTLHVLILGQIQPPDPSQVANLTRNLYLRVVGVPPNVTDLTNPATVYARMYAAVQSGQLLQAAELATSQDGFYNVTLRNMATSLSNQLFESLYPLNDFVTTWIGIARDGLDARQLLTGNFIYAPNSYGTCTGSGATFSCANLPASTCATPKSVVYNETGKAFNVSGGAADLYSSGAAFQAMDDNFLNIRKNLVQVPQCAYNSFDLGATPSLLVNSHLQAANGAQAPASAGLLTSRAWAIAHLYQGTNRRAIREAMNVFLCTDITMLQDSTMADGHVRRDVDRAPGGVARTYVNQCVACHSGMDAMSGAYSYFDTYWPNGAQQDMQSVASSSMRMVYSDQTMQTYADNMDDPNNCSGTSSTMPKVKRNCTVFAPGYVPGDDSWVNEFIANQNANLGWDPGTPLNGNGVNAFGNMLANSAQFGVCMAQRAFTAVCKRPPVASEMADVKNIAQDFSVSHSFTRLFALAATLPECLANSGGN